MFLAVFRSRKRPDMDAFAYDADLTLMEELAAVQPGYRSFKSYTAEDGETVAISEWESEADALEWRRMAEHVGVQLKGRSDYYESYTLFACNEPRIHHYDMKEKT